MLSLGLQNCSRSLVTLLLQHLTASILERLQLVVSVLFGAESIHTLHSFGPFATRSYCSC